MLSQLVAYYNTLLEIPITDITERSKKDFLTVSADASRTDKTWSALKNLNEKKAQIDSALSGLTHDLEELKKEVKQEIDLLSKPYFVDSYQRYEDMRSDTAEYILNRQIPTDIETESMIIGRARSMSDWRYPGIVFRPGARSYIKHLVAGDPLYIVDTDYDLLAPALDHFNEPYRSRLRPIVVDEQKDTYLSRIPKQQIGMIFALDFFEYKPLEVLKTYFADFYEVLRPGGVGMISYNNCDIAHGVKMCETKTRCFTPGSMVVDLLEISGFEVLSRHDRTASFSWIEFRKPGILSSLRGGQSLAKILDKHKEVVYNEENIPQPEPPRVIQKTYTRYEAEQLRKEAIRLNIPQARSIEPTELARLIDDIKKGKNP